LTRIVDNVTPGIDFVAIENSPVARAPWKKFVRSSTYAEIVKSLNSAGSQPIAAAKSDVTVPGILPGDDARPTAFVNSIKPQTDCACPTPTNFRQTLGRDNGNGILYFEYAWGSTSGNVADLTNCEVGEHVTYPGGSPFAWPSPPFSISTSNPTVRWHPATWGAFGDQHSTPGFVKPYQAASVTATQNYRFRCTCHNNNTPVVLMGPISIVRSVTQNANQTFRYTITKSGVSATINPLP
jgi:hypothetical protein